MFEDGRSVPGSTVLDADVCIVGSGPAGLTVARVLAESSARVVLLERGRDGAGAAPGDLEFSSPHFRSPHASMAARFGGMVSAWNSVLDDGSAGARYLPLDPIDFEPRSWIPHSGWPITFGELRTYYERAAEHCGIDAIDHHAPLPPDEARPALTTPSGALVSRLDLLGPASVFTVRARRALESASTVRVVTNATVVELRPGVDGSGVSTEVRAAGNSFSVRSSFVVVAAGAIDNARLLLSSTAFHPAGLGNQCDNVGRYYMDHPRIRLGHGPLSPGVDPTSMGRYELHVDAGRRLTAKLKLADAVLRQTALLNGNAQVAAHVLTVDQLAAVESARTMYEAIRSHRWPARPRSSASPDLPHAAAAVLAAGWRLLSIRAMGGRELAAGRHRWSTASRSLRLNYQPEQAPIGDNRVTLAERSDEHGYPVAHLSWRWSNLDLDSIGRASRIFRSEISASGLGELLMAEEGLPRGELGGPPESAHHHLGTTRMSHSPEDGVVDAHCRIHGTSEIYVAGGSVFVTSGCANPTLTIVALALRVADELRALRRPSAPVVVHGARGRRPCP